MPAVKSKLEEIPPPKTPWSPAHRDTLDLLTSSERPPLSVLLLAGSTAQPWLLGMLLLTPAPKIVSEDDIPVNVESLDGCILSRILSWLHLVLPAAMAHGQPELSFAGFVCE